MAVGERLEEDLVLAEEPGERRHAGNRDRANEERPVGDRQVLLQPTHVADVLLAVERVNDGAGAQEQQRLEERVRVEMKDAGGKGADPHRQEHVAELRDGRVGEHALDVVLHQPDGAGHQRGRDADARDDRERDRRMLEQHGVAADHVYARRHHRRRMDEGRDRGRAFHRVG